MQLQAIEQLHRLNLTLHENPHNGVAYWSVGSHTLKVSDGITTGYYGSDSLVEYLSTLRPGDITLDDEGSRGSRACHKPLLPSSSKRSAL